MAAFFSWHMRASSRPKSAPVSSPHESRAIQVDTPRIRSVRMTSLPVIMAHPSSDQRLSGARLLALALSRDGLPGVGHAAYPHSVDYLRAVSPCSLILVSLC